MGADGSKLAGHTKNIVRKGQDIAMTVSDISKNAEIAAAGAETMNPLVVAYEARNIFKKSKKLAEKVGDAVGEIKETGKDAKEIAEKNGIISKPEVTKDNADPEKMSYKQARKKYNYPMTTSELVQLSLAKRIYH